MGVMGFDGFPEVLLMGVDVLKDGGGVRGIGLDDFVIFADIFGKCGFLISHLLF